MASTPSTRASCRPMDSDEDWPLLIQATDSSVAMVDWVSDHGEFLNERLTTSGAILLRGFEVSSVSEFEVIIKQHSPSFGMVQSIGEKLREKTFIAFGFTQK